MKKAINVILKITERCNIDCTYCYFFYSNDKSYLNHPPYLTETAAQNIANWLRQGVIDLGIEHVTIGLHGGEPLMIKPDIFSNFCAKFVDSISPYATLKFNLQTNAMLVNDIWCQIFDTYDIHVGVSLDGPKEYNDKYRIDKRGQGTYERVIAGIEALKQTKRVQKAGGVSLLTVINPSFNAQLIYDHFFNELKASFCDFLLPITTHDDHLNYAAIDYGQFLCELFDIWEKDNNPQRKIRILSGTINSFLGGYSHIYGTGKNTDKTALPLISVASNGDLGPSDDLRACKNLFPANYNAATTSMKDFLNLEIFTEIESARLTVPYACKICCWHKICNGGTLVTRYSENQHFNNRSILCSGLYEFHSHIAAYLVKNGIPKEQILKNLELI